MSDPRGRRAATGPEMVVDRIEGEIIVVELAGGTMLDLPLWMLPDAAKEGDVIRARVSGSGADRRIDLEIDPTETARRKAVARESLERLRSRDPGGDIEL